MSAVIDCIRVFLWRTMLIAAIAGFAYNLWADITNKKEKMKKAKKGVRSTTNKL